MMHCRYKFIIIRLFATRIVDIFLCCALIIQYSTYLFVHYCEVICIVFYGYIMSCIMCISSCIKWLSTH